MYDKIISLELWTSRRYLLVTLCLHELVFKIFFSNACDMQWLAKCDQIRICRIESSVEDERLSFDIHNSQTKADAKRAFINVYSMVQILVFVIIYFPSTGYDFTFPPLLSKTVDRRCMVLISPFLYSSNEDPLWTWRKTLYSQISVA